MKGLVESLASTGETLSDNYLRDYIMGGLSSQYKCLLTTVRSRGPITFVELTDLLLGEVLLVKRINEENHSQVTVAMAAQSGYRGNFGKVNSLMVDFRDMYRGDIILVIILITISNIIQILIPFLITITNYITNIASNQIIITKGPTSQTFNPTTDLSILTNNIRILILI